MNLFERYLAEVGRQLPKGRRDDILSELRSLLEDAYEAHAAGGSGATADEQTRSEILAEFGPPERFAAAYLPERRYLIGPRYYPSFLSTLKICFWVVLGIVGTGLLLDLLDGFDSLPDFALTLGAAFGDLLTSAVSVFGMVVLIFLLIERGSSEPGERPEVDWDPQTLPQPEDPRRVDVPGTLVGMALAIVGLVVFNLLPDKVCVFFNIGADRFTVPMLGPAFAARLPWLNLYLLLGLGLGILTIRQGHWTRWLRLVDLLVHLLVFVFFFLLATGDMVVEFGADWLVSHGLPAESAQDLAEDVGPIMSTLLRVAFWVTLVVVGIGGIHKLRTVVAGERARRA